MTLTVQGAALVARRNHWQSARGTARKGIHPRIDQAAPRSGETPVLQKMWLQASGPHSNHKIDQYYLSRDCTLPVKEGGGDQNAEDVPISGARGMMQRPRRSESFGALASAGGVGLVQV
jgi:hypothetical protein